MAQHVGFSILHDAVEVQRRRLQSRLSEQYIQRQLPFRFRDDHLIKVIIGPRRCGKSFLAMHLLAQAASRGYLNFDDERLVDVEDYDLLLAAVNAVYGESPSSAARRDPEPAEMGVLRESPCSVRGTGCC